MARLLLKFDSQILREIPIAGRPVTIGRAPDNDVAIDNLAVSDHHARLYAEGHHLVIEDLSSLNGTYVNDARIERAALRDGDTIQIGKHQLQLDAAHDAAAPAPGGLRKAPVPKLIETAVLDTEVQRELLRQTAAAGSGVGLGAGAGAGAGKLSPASTQRLRPAILRVLRGRTDKREYVLAGKLTVIGRSDMASVRLLGWFAPQVAAQINRHDDGYYLGLGDRIPKVNGQPIQGPTRLRDGDIIELGRVRLLFSSPD
jgi:pSer/pThr/pTyr-binding forkhead associated (FHA) protein